MENETTFIVFADGTKEYFLLNDLVKETMKEILAGSIVIQEKDINHCNNISNYKNIPFTGISINIIRKEKDLTSEGYDKFINYVIVFEKRYYKNGKLHGEDGTATVDVSGTENYIKYGLYHRENGPARIWPDGTQYYYKNGSLHREDGPAVILSDGTQYYYKNGLYHREDGPAIIHPDGRKEYYKNDNLHREDGPAVIWSDGRKEYWIDGKLHRDNGPAIEHPDGRKEYYINGIFQKPTLDDVMKSMSKNTTNYNKKQNNMPNQVNFEKLYVKDLKFYYRNNLFTGKTIDQFGIEHYIKNGEYHREDGPAIIHPNGIKYYYLNGIKINETLPSRLENKDELENKDNRVAYFDVSKCTPKHAEEYISAMKNKFDKLNNNKRESSKMPNFILKSLKYITFTIIIIGALLLANASLHYADSNHYHLRNYCQTCKNITISVPSNNFCSKCGTNSKFSQVSVNKYYNEFPLPFTNYTTYTTVKNPTTGEILLQTQE